MVAGPSEILIVADETANPKFVAADLMSQAEHDKLASPMLLTTSPALAEAVDKELARQMSYLERSEMMEQSFANFGAGDCLRLSGSVCGVGRRDCAGASGALYGGARALLPKVKNAGAVFLGHWAPGASGRLLCRARPRPAYLGHRAVFLAAVCGQLLEDDERHGV